MIQFRKQCLGSARFWLGKISTKYWKKKTLFYSQPKSELLKQERLQKYPALLMVEKIKKI